MYASTSIRIDDDRVAALICREADGEHLMRFRNGGLATEVRLSKAAMIAVVEMFFSLHGDNILMAPKEGE